MKKLTLAIFLLIFVLCCESHAQTIDKNKLPNYGSYVGTWVGTDGTDSLVVKLEKKVEYVKRVNRKITTLIGKHYYYRNKKLISNNFDSKERTLVQGYLRKNPNKGSFLDFTFKDLRKRKQGHAFLFFKDSTHKIARWELRAMEGSFIDRKIPEGYYEFSIPKEMTLRKVNKK